MSLIDKLAKQSILQNQLQSQLAEMSYKQSTGKDKKLEISKRGPRKGGALVAPGYSAGE